MDKIPYLGSGKKKFLIHPLDFFSKLYLALYEGSDRVMLYDFRKISYLWDGFVIAWPSIDWTSVKDGQHKRENTLKRSTDFYIFILLLATTTVVLWVKVYSHHQVFPQFFNV